MEDRFTLPPERLRTVWIIWGSLLFSVVPYTIFVYATRNNPEFPKQPPETLQMLLFAFLGVAVMATMMVFLVLPRVLIKRKSNPQKMVTAYLSFSIVRWALCESITILGLIYAVLGGNFNYFLIFVGWTVLLMLVCAPNARDQESYERQARQN